MRSRVEVQSVHHVARGRDWRLRRELQILRPRRRTRNDDRVGVDRTDGADDGIVVEQESGPVHIVWFARNFVQNVFLAFVQSGVLLPKVNRQACRGAGRVQIRIRVSYSHDVPIDYHVDT